MKITFQCTYIGKPSGYEEKSFDKDKKLCKDFIEDVGRIFITRHIAPTQSVILFLDSQNRLSLSITSVGRSLSVERENSSPWKYVNDSRIISLYLAEEESCDRDTIYSVFIEFCTNYLESANKLLDLLEVTPDNLSCQYNIPYDAFYKTFVTDIKKHNCPKINLPSKSIVLLYSPFYQFDGKKKQNLCEKFKDVGIFLEKRRIINIPENYLGVMKNTLINYILTMINLLFNK